MDLASSLESRLNEFLAKPTKTVSEKGMRLLALVAMDSQMREPLKNMVLGMLFPALMTHAANGTKLGKAVIDVLEGILDDDDPMFQGMPTEEQAAVQMLANSLLQQVGGK